MAPDERAKLLSVLASLYEGAGEHHWQEANDISEQAVGYPYMEMITAAEFRTWLDERIKETDK